MIQYKHIPTVPFATGKTARDSAEDWLCEMLSKVIILGQTAPTQREHDEMRVMGEDLISKLAQINMHEYMRLPEVRA